MEKRKGKRGRVGGGRETGEADEEAEREKGEATSDVRRRETSEGEKANARKSPRPSSSRSPLSHLPSTPALSQALDPSSSDASSLSISAPANASAPLACLSGVLAGFPADRAVRWAGGGPRAFR